MASLVLAACGGSSHSSSSTSSASPSATRTAAPTSVTGTGTVSAGPTTTTATTSSRPPEVPKNKAPKHSKATAPNTNVRIPAAFIIGAGGAITPPLISVPPKVTIELLLHNRDTLAHRVQLSVAHFPTVSVPPGGSKTTDISGVSKGNYRLLVDGTTRARIVVGAVPGP
jgi:hypothetical protein